ncbi:hypothetical protein HQ590_12365 [bacterium]|nr:hypothetical protein [bacterium]
MDVLVGRPDVAHAVVGTRGLALKREEVRVGKHRRADHIGHAFLDPDGGAAAGGLAPGAVDGLAQEPVAGVGDQFGLFGDERHHPLKAPDPVASPERGGYIPGGQPHLAVAPDQFGGNVPASLGDRLFGRKLFRHGNVYIQRGRGQRGRFGLDLLAAGDNRPAADPRFLDDGALAGPAVEVGDPLAAGVGLEYERLALGAGRAFPNVEPVLAGELDDPAVILDRALDFRGVPVPPGRAELVLVVAEVNALIRDHRRDRRCAVRAERRCEFLATSHAVLLIPEAPPGWFYGAGWQMVPNSFSRASWPAARLSAAGRGSTLPRFAGPDPRSNPPAHPIVGDVLRFSCCKIGKLAAKEPCRRQNQRDRLQMCSSTDRMVWIGGQIVLLDGRPPVEVIAGWSLRLAGNDVRRKGSLADVV